MWLAISIMFNVIVIFVLVATKIGIAVVRRFFNGLRYKTGKYVNTLIFLKTGVMKEVFKKKIEGKFTFNKESYTTNPRLLMPYRGIPSYIHLESQPSPINIFKEGENDLPSAAEIDTVMLSVNNFDFMAWVQKYAPYIMIGALILVAALAASAYLNYSVFQMLRDGTYKTVEVAAAALTPT